MKNIFTIIKKELSRVFKDPRLVLTTFILPGLMIFVMYSILGDTMVSQRKKVYDKETQVFLVDAPDDYKSMLSNPEVAGFKVIINEIEADEVESITPKLLDKTAEAIVVFPSDFLEKIENLTNGSELPQVRTYYNPGEDNSSFAHTKILSVLNVYQQSKIAERVDNYPLFTINGVDGPTEIVDQKKMQGKAFASLLPFLILTFLFSGAMGVGPESIAGDKERGTMATLLITPTKRSEIALGKILSLSIMAVVSAISSFIGILLSLPKLMGGSLSGAMIYSINEFAPLLILLISVVVVIIGAIALISCYAKNVKEASMLVLPLFFVSMFVGISTMFNNTVSNNPFVYLIPLYNSVQVMTAIFTFELSITNFLITIGSNLVYSILLVVALTKMLNSERILFSK